MDTTVNEISLSRENGTYQATFPSSQSLSVTASNFLLSMQFTGETGTMQNNSRGLLGEKQNFITSRLWIVHSSTRSMAANLRHECQRWHSYPSLWAHARTKFVTRTIEGGRVRLLPKSGQPLEMTLLRRVGLVTFLVLHQEHPLTLHVTLEIAVELTYPVVMAFNKTLLV